MPLPLLVPAAPAPASAASLRGRAAAAALLLLPLACRSAEVRRAEAGAEVYRIVASARARFAADPATFTIEPAAGSLRQRILSGEAEGAGAPQAGGVVSLTEALSIAAENSRDYQAEKESLYLAALDLTFERYRFRVQKSGTLGALLSGSGDSAESVDFDGDLVLTRLLGTGAKIVGSIGLSLARTLSSSDGFDAASALSLSVTQPLLRGFGGRIVLEPLTQAERDVVYAVRSFERFRRTFGVDVAERYYRLLQQADAVENEERNFANLEVLRLRNEALAEAGRLSDIEVGQARQDELRSRDRLVQERARYEEQLDDLKLFLGLPIPARIAPARSELERLSVDAVEGLAWEEEGLVALALEERLDYLTELDRRDDAGRQVEIAADALRAALDVTATADASSEEGKPLNVDANDVGWTLGLDVDLPIDRLAERNAYRAAEIERDQSARSAEELADQIRADLRDALRQVLSTMETWRIQQGAVALAERRVENTRLNLDAGRADTRDILEAQESLLEARNAATRALIDHRLALLGLWRDLEVLRLDEAGLGLDPELSERMEGLRL